MVRARIVWPPHPWRAGFSITDDPDASDLASTRLVYDFMRSIGLRTTKAVWVYEPVEGSGIPPTPPSTLRGITLQDPRYFDYCRVLKREGFEICLHGASAGNNVRQRTMQAFEFMNEHFGLSGTYICHSKNVENMYWESKVASSTVLRLPLSLYARRLSLGDVEGSDYFWGDVCRQHVSQIRLFRTRETNTLAANPSMPYFEEGKPFVRGWFSATKRRFVDCATPEALSRLKEENGLTVLYQYLHRYAVAEEATVQEEFRTAAVRLMADREIWVAPASEIMSRLRQMQQLFVVYKDHQCWIANVGDRATEQVQIMLSRRVLLKGPHPGISVFPDKIVAHSIGPGSIVRLEFHEDISFAGGRVGRPARSGVATIDFGHGRLTLDTSVLPIEANSSLGIGVKGFRLEFDRGLEAARPFSRAEPGELHHLLAGQTWIIAREILRRKRTLNQNKFLNREVIPLEDHNNW